ncbi:MAG: DUF1566 domain-containing protein [Proteobacteria bacterium]|nr:DUF1566 domain-containing protein [Pseudomonadota bacterium]
MKTIGKYEVRGLLGRGGMGVVYKVRLPSIGRIMALKLLAPRPELVALLGESEIRRRFLDEARTMGRLRHPNIAGVWDFEPGPGPTFFVMDYYCHNLGALIGERYDLEAPTRVFPVERASGLVRQTLSGLARLHHAGIVHRDLKPYNLLLTDEDVIKITDFGLSLLRGETRPHPGRLRIGSPYYAAPEQVRDPDGVGPPADLYAAGVTLFRLLTGRLPDEDRTRLDDYRADLGPDWEAFIGRALDPDPARRFSSASDMASALEGLIESWRETFGLACSLEPEPAVSNGRTPLRPPLPRSSAVKVAPAEAQDVFDTDELDRPRTYRINDFQESGPDRIEDRATGLAWQRSGSEFPMAWAETAAYLEVLNRDRPAGRNDWRLPTVDELLTLLDPPPSGGGRCIASRFDRAKRHIWSADRRSATAAWYVNTDVGFASPLDKTCLCHVRAVSGPEN